MTARPALRAGPLELHPDACAATLDGRPVRLSALEFDLLHHLVAHAGRVCTVEELYRDVWRGGPLRAPTGGSGRPKPPNATVIEHVRRVRGRLGRHAWPLITVPGRGYRWAAPSEPVGPAPPPEIDADGAAVAMGLAEGVCAAAQVLADMPEADRETALKRLRANPAVRWMAGGT